ncbi:hypothetical protein P9112_007416 [Eukaryota sp. TZLM1-RC]
MSTRSHSSLSTLNDASAFVLHHHRPSEVHISSSFDCSRQHSNTLTLDTMNDSIHQQSSELNSVLSQIPDNHFYFNRFRQHIKDSPIPFHQKLARMDAMKAVADLESFDNTTENSLSIEHQYCLHLLSL